MIEAPGHADSPRRNLLGFHGDGDRTLYFHGHYDVVPAQAPTQFNPELREGRLFGRGSADMKSGLASMIYAAHALKANDVPLSGRIGLCIVADEETSGTGGSAYLDQLGLLGREAVGMLTPEPTSGVIWNASRGALTLRVNVQGRAAHVGLQHQGVNAFERMLKVGERLLALKREVEARQTGYRVNPPAAAGSILMLGGRVEGGTNFNMVPESCAFTLERRFNPEEELETEKAELLGLFESLRSEGIEVEAEILQQGEATGIRESEPLARVLCETVASVSGQPPAFEMCPGLLETRWYTRRGIPAFAYGPGSLELAHGPDESVAVERVSECALVYALTAARLLS
jgi:acetylornithine deacetylase/succinyl-diaminopimelate desuccinylase-like protein